jgi:hypothetical protein
LPYFNYIVDTILPYFNYIINIIFYIILHIQYIVIIKHMVK